MVDEKLDELRQQIWDLIFKQGPQTAEQLSQQLELPQETIAEAITCDWFRVDDESKVAIA